MENYLSSLGINVAGGVGVFLTTLLFVLLAEMGDKTQLLVMAFATRYKLRQVVVGVTLSIILLNSLAVLMGSLLTTIIPISYIQFLASVSFIIFGIMAFKKDEDEEETKVLRINPTLAVAASFFVAELGDKTQLATMAIAAKYQAPLQVLLGSIIAMLIADTIGLVAGVAVNKYVPQKYIKIISGIVFIGFGIAGLSSFIPPDQLSRMTQSAVLGIGLVALLIIILLVFAPASRKKSRR